MIICTRKHFKKIRLRDYKNFNSLKWILPKTWALWQGTFPRIGTLNSSFETYFHDSIIGTGMAFWDFPLGEFESPFRGLRPKANIFWVGQLRGYIYLGMWVGNTDTHWFHSGGPGQKKGFDKGPPKGTLNFHPNGHTFLRGVWAQKPPRRGGIFRKKRAP